MERQRSANFKLKYPTFLLKSKNKESQITCWWFVNTVAMPTELSKVGYIAKSKINVVIDGKTYIKSDKIYEK